MAQAVCHRGLYTPQTKVKTQQGPKPLNHKAPPPPNLLWRQQGEVAQAVRHRGGALLLPAGAAQQQRKQLGHAGCGRGGII